MYVQWYNVHIRVYAFMYIFTCIYEKNTRVNQKRMEQNNRKQKVESNSKESLNLFQKCGNKRNEWKEKEG